MLQLLKRPSAFVPLAISGAFLAALLTAFAQGRLARAPDEGTGAHLFQIVMPLQLLITLFFAATWLPRNTKPALGVLALQSCAAIGVLAIVYFNRL